MKVVEKSFYVMQFSCSAKKLLGVVFKLPFYKLADSCNEAIIKHRASHGIPFLCFVTR